MSPPLCGSELGSSKKPAPNFFKAFKSTEIRLKPAPTDSFFNVLGRIWAGQEVDENVLKVHKTVEFADMLWISHRTVLWSHSSPLHVIVTIRESCLITMFLFVDKESQLTTDKFEVFFSRIKLHDINSENNAKLYE